MIIKFSDGEVKQIIKAYVKNKYLINAQTVDNVRKSTNYDIGVDVEIVDKEKESMGIYTEHENDLAIGIDGDI